MLRRLFNFLVLRHAGQQPQIIVVQGEFTPCSDWDAVTVEVHVPSNAALMFSELKTKGKISHV